MPECARETILVVGETPEDLGTWRWNGGRGKAPQSRRGLASGGAAPERATIPDGQTVWSGVNVR